MRTVDHRDILLNIYMIIQHSILSAVKFHEVIFYHIVFLTIGYKGLHTDSHLLIDDQEKSLVNVKHIIVVMQMPWNESIYTTVV